MLPTVGGDQQTLRVTSACHTSTHVDTPLVRMTLCGAWTAGRHQRPSLVDRATSGITRARPARTVERQASAPAPPGTGMHLPEKDAAPADVSCHV